MDKSRLNIILSKLTETTRKNVSGDIVEFGCYIGTTSLFIQRLLDIQGSQKQFFVYDSFDGLPNKSIEDASMAGSAFRAGELKTSKRALIRNFKHAGLKTPVIHKAWFNELKPKQLPDAISFAFLDGDFYHSITDSLELVWPRLSEGGIIVIDDFMRSNLPGVTRAVEDFFKSSEVSIRHQSNLAIIFKA